MHIKLATMSGFQCGSDYYYCHSHNVWRAQEVCFHRTSTGWWWWQVGSETKCWRWVWTWNRVETGFYAGISRALSLPCVVIVARTSVYGGMQTKLVAAQHKGSTMIGKLQNRKLFPSLVEQLLVWLSVELSVQWKERFSDWNDPQNHSRQ